MATRHALTELAVTYRAATGRSVTVHAMGGLDAARRIRDGGSFDLAILAEAALTQLAAEGCLMAGSMRTFALSQTAVAVRAGAPRPPLWDEAAIQSLIGSARAIGLSTGPSGAAMRDLLQRWHASGLPLPQIVQAPPGVPVARLLAAGDVDLGVQQLSELMGEPGIEIVGLMPETLIPLTTFSVALCRTGRHTSEAQNLLDALTVPAAASILQRHGLSPPRPA